MVVGITGTASALSHVLDLGNVALLYLLPVMAAATAATAGTRSPAAGAERTRELVATALHPRFGQDVRGQVLHRDGLEVVEVTVRATLAGTISSTTAKAPAAATAVASASTADAASPRPCTR